ncbi:MAG: lamin tail domain-containing protein [Flavobacteriaceae bacterium]|nr:lamin tail domain-containing protein [Flavobacteriaceae bacterium]
MIEKGTNGAATSSDFTLSTGTLAVGDVIVIGTSDMQTTTENNGATFFEKSFTFNGDDALVVKYGGTTTDIFGTPGSDPGSSWSGSGVSTANQNISLKSGITSGDTDGWTDPSERFENTADGSTLTGFGIAPTAANTPGITLGAVSGNTSEDGTQATFTVVLNTQPTTDVVLNVTSGDTGEVTVDLATLTFTNANWDTPQTVTATGIDDAIQDGSIDVTITISVDDGLSDDAYDAVDDVTTTVTNEDNELTDLVINEVLADPDATTGDANGDGTVSTQDDEFVELYNTTGSALDISGYKLSDDASERHVFPNGTVIPANGSIVVFGGGIVSDFTSVGGLVQVSSTEALGLNNGGDTITILDASDVLVVTESYGAAGNDQSIARSPDFTGSFVDHSTILTNPVDFSPGKDNTDNLPFIKTWTGTTDNIWTTTTNWLESDVPGASDNAIVRAGATNYPRASAAAVTVASLIIESGATLVTTNTFSGNVTYKRNLENGSQWYLMSSPVVGEMYDDAWNTANSIDNGQGNNRGVSWYDNSSSDGTTGHWRYLQATNSGTFNVGQGYSIRLSTSGDVSFVGSGIYTSDQTFALTQGANNFNLIGNPFTGFITLGTFEATNGSVIEDEYYFWTGSAYVTRNNNNDSAFEIAPGQGFFVEATSANNVTFQVSDVSHGSETFNTKTSNIRPEIHLSVIEGAKTIPVRILYTEGTTRGFDTGYDGKLFSGASSDFMAYSDLVESNGIKYQTQVLPNQDHENMVIPVGLIAEAGKEITFTAEALNIPNGLQVYLEDRVTGAITRLDEANSEYKVTLSENLDGVGRFYLHTKSSAVLSTDDLALQGVQIFASTHRTLEVTGVNSTKASLKLYNLLGKQVMQTSFSSTGKSTLNVPNLSTGVYIVQLSTDKG